MERPVVYDGAVLRDPEGMSEHERVWDEEKENNPEERRERDS
jgi:hypothetical protein